VELEIKAKYGYTYYYYYYFAADIGAMTIYVNVFEII